MFQININKTTENVQSLADRQEDILKTTKGLCYSGGWILLSHS